MIILEAILSYSKQNDVQQCRIKLWPMVHYSAMRFVELPNSLGSVVPVHGEPGSVLHFKT